MDRADFVDRKGVRKVDFLQYYNLIERIYAKDNNLKIATLRLLFYLAPLPYFTRDDFTDGTLYYSWDQSRFERLLQDGWIKIAVQSDKSKGHRYRYVISLKGTILVNTVYDICVGKEQLPEKCKRNRRKKRNSKFIERAEGKAIKAMETNRAKERRENF